MYAAFHFLSFMSACMTLCSLNRMCAYAKNPMINLKLDFITCESNEGMAALVVCVCTSRCSVIVVCVQ